MGLKVVTRDVAEKTHRHHDRAGDQDRQTNRCNPGSAKICWRRRSFRRELVLTWSHRSDYGLLFAAVGGGVCSDAGMREGSGLSGEVCK